MKNTWYIPRPYASVFWCWCSVSRLHTRSTGLLLAYEDYGFILKITKVSNPMQRNRKRPGMSSNPCDLKNIARPSKMHHVLHRDNMVLKLCERTI